MIPAILISGYSDSGKTTIIEQLLEIYTSKGYDVATVKHHKGSFDVGENKDSSKHLKSGATSVSLASDEEYIVIKKLKKKNDLNEILNNISGVDLILVEGYKSEDFPKIEVYRKKMNNPRLDDKKNIFGIVSEDLDESYESVPVFKTDEIDKLAKLIEDKFIYRKVG